MRHQQPKRPLPVCSHQHRETVHCDFCCRFHTMSDVDETGEDTVSELAGGEFPALGDSVELEIADDTYSGETFVAEDAEFTSGSSTPTLLSFPIDDNSILNRNVQTAPPYVDSNRLEAVGNVRGTITSAPIGMKSPFWSSDKKSWKASNGFVNLDAEPIVMATPPKQASTPPTPAISNNYATLAQAEKAATTAVPSGDGGEAQRKAIEQARQKRNRYHDRKVTLRNADTVSIHSMRRPLVPQRPTAIIASSSGLGPLSQWQLTGENYIDSDMRKRHRAAIGRRSDDHAELTKENRRVMYRGPHGTWETSHSGESSSTSSTPNSLTSSMADVEKPLRKPREERSTVFDRTVRIPRKKLVLNGPLHSTSYSHWNSQVFPRPETD